MPGGQLVDDIRRFLRGIQALQEEMAALYRRKRVALTEACVADLLQIAETEARLAKQMQVKLAERRQLLLESADSGFPGSTVQEVVAALDDEARAELEPQVVRTRHIADEVRRETWIHWIVAQRTLGHYRQLLELVAHCGRSSPTYSRRPGQESSGGGAILDASA